MRRRLLFLGCGLAVRFGLAVIAVAASSAAVGGELGLFAKYDWINGAEDVSGSRLRHDGVLDPGTTVSDGKVHLQGWDGVDLGYMPELDGAQEVLLRFEDVTLLGNPNEAVLAGGGDRFNPNHWLVGMEVDDPDVGGEAWQSVLFFSVGPEHYLLPPGWQLRVPALTGTTLESVNHFESMEFRFTTAAPAGEQLAIRWDGGGWITGGWGEGTFAEFPSPFPVRLNDGYRADEHPVWADVGPVSFYSDRANVPEPGTLALIVVGVALVTAWQWYRIANRRE